MKPLLIALILFWTSLSPSLFAQSSGVVEGRLANRTDPAILPGGVELEALELDAGMNIIKTTVTAGDGTFRIEGLSVSRPLMIRATYKGVNYHSRPEFDANGRARLEMAVYEPGASRDDISVESISIVFQMEANVLRSLETVILNNSSRPPVVFSHPEGSYRISKAADLIDSPLFRVTAPDSSMPVTQPAMESVDGASYFSSYPLKPGLTTFEIQQAVSYTGEPYRYIRRFHLDSDPVDIGLIPHDLELQGEGLTLLQTDRQGNYAVYKSSPVKAGMEFAWTFSGGTPVTRGADPSAAAPRSTIMPLPGAIGRNALVILPLLLMGFILVLWYASTTLGKQSDESSRRRERKLEEHRERLLDLIVRAEHRCETGEAEPAGYRQQREELKHRLRRVYQLMKMS